MNATPMLDITPTRTGADLHGDIVRLVSGCSIEATPAAAAKIPDFRDYLAPGTEVFITFLAGTDHGDIVKLAKRLREEGFEPVPHFAARNLKDRADLQRYVEAAAGEAGVTRALVIAGAPNKPIGDYVHSMHLLETGLFEANGIRDIAVAGHPESCTDCSDAELMKALHTKAAYARSTGAKVSIVTQFCFQAEPLISYDAMLRREGLDLPVHVGVPGVAALKTLIKFATMCGVGNSMDFLRRQAKHVSRLLKLNAPDKLLIDLATYLAGRDETQIADLHFFPLGGFDKTAQWAKAVGVGAFELAGDGSSFTVDPDFS